MRDFLISLGTNEDARKAYEDYTRTSYTFEELTARVLPKGVDPLLKETYLSDEDFYEVFAMSKEDYEKKPKWKREEIKKQVGLY